MLLTFALVAALAAPADSVSGTWLIKGDVAGNPLESTCTIVVAEAKISGSCKNAEGSMNVIGIPPTTGASRPQASPKS